MINIFQSNGYLVGKGVWKFRIWGIPKDVDYILFLKLNGGYEEH
jgi:hypothetical protein